MALFLPAWNKVLGTLPAEEQAELLALLAERALDDDTEDAAS